ncbi:MAG: PQQ-binding-like beta-propeller repeat protein [Deltaproteobacteria bacterium]|nr:PQQ-binding-like beta-propeller repeat protein [Deltaproteobacteria bacterium]
MTIRLPLLVILSIPFLATACSSHSTGAGDAGTDAAVDASDDPVADGVPGDTAPDRAEPPLDAAPDLVGDAVPDAIPDSAPLDSGDDTTQDILPDMCQPDCEGKVCGDDGCGGSCGECGGEDACMAGVCVPPVHALEIVSGDAQEAAPDQLLAPLVVRAIAADGSPVPGVEILFSAPPGAWVEPAGATTDSSGEATGEARLGLALGPQEFTVSAEALVPLLITATAMEPAPGTIFTVVNVDHDAGSLEEGPGTVAHAGSVHGVVAGSDGSVFLSEAQESCSVYRLSPTGELSRIAGTGVCGFSGDGGPAMDAELDDPAGLALDEESGLLFIADAGNGRIRTVELESGTITTLAGGGDAPAPVYGDGQSATDATLGAPDGLLLGPGPALYITSSAPPRRVRQIDLATGTISTVIPNTADPGLPLSLVAAGGSMAWDPDGRLLLAGSFVGSSVNPANPDQETFAVARVDWDGALVQVAGLAGGSSEDSVPASEALLTGVAFLATDRAGNLFLALPSEHRVRRLDVASGLLETVAGTGVAGFGGDYGDGDDAQLNLPHGLALGPAGDLFIADKGNHAMRLLWHVGEMVAPERVSDLALDSMGRCFGVTPSGTLLSLNASEEDDPATLADERFGWASPGGWEAVAPVIAPEGRVVACRNSALVWLSRNTGQEEGSVPDACNRAIALADDGSLYGVATGAVRRVAFPGTVLWDVSPGPAQLDTLAVLDSGTVIAVAVGEGVFGLDPGNGTTLWEYPCAAAGALAVGRQDRVYVATQNGVHSFDAADCVAGSCPSTAVADLSGYGPTGAWLIADDQERLYLPAGGGILALDGTNPVWFQPAVDGQVALLTLGSRLHVGSLLGEVVTLSTWWGMILDAEPVAPGSAVVGMSMGNNGTLWTRAGSVVSKQLYFSSQLPLSSGPWPKLRRDRSNSANAGLRDSCVVSCAGIACGPDGCSGKCGTCQSGESCVSGACQSSGCGGVTGVGCCQDSVNVYCFNGSLASFSCGLIGAPYNQCGWLAGPGGLGAYGCGNSSASGPPEHPRDCDFTCQPDCTDKECGSDGCGGTCGSCSEGEQCFVGYCMTDCGSIPDVGCCLGGSLLICKEDEGLIQQVCGLTGCGWSAWDGGFVCGGDPKPPPEYAMECDPDCIPLCAGKECGPNGCGALCGHCAANEICEGGTCVCVPACAGKQCGADGCGGSCGICAAGFGCSNDVCICIPDCTGKDCAGDGCGGSCGVCGTGSACDDGVCVVLTQCGDGACSTVLLEDCATCPEDCGCGCGGECQMGVCVFTACDGKECGDDGCGGTCGECPDDPCFADCVSGSCSHATTIPEECNSQDDDCDGAVDENGADGCTVYHHDGDGDGFGDPVDPQCICAESAPGGFVTNASDCCDSDASVHPGQAGWFTSASGPCGGSWDFDCANGVEYEHGLAVGACGPIWPICNLVVGWEGSAAACGQQKPWISGCSAFLFTCGANTISKSQGCH